MSPVRVTLIETPVFTAQVLAELTDEEYADLQAFLAEQPTAGSVIRGTGGARKLRWIHPRRQTGKRGGLRTIYYYRDAHEQIIMLYLFSKDEQSDLSVEQRKALKAVIKSWN